MKFYKPMITYIRLLKYIKPVISTFVIGIMSTSIAGFLDGWLGQYMKPLINDGFAHANPAVIVYMPLYILAYFVFRALVGFLSVFCLYQTGNFIMATLRREAFMRFMGSRYASVKDANVGGFLSLLNYNISQVEDATTGSLRRFLLDIVLITTSIISLCKISIFLTSLIIIIVPMAYMAMKIFSYKTRRESSNVQNNLAHVIRYAEQSIHAVSTIRSMSAYENVLSRFDDLLRITLVHQKRFTVASSLMHASLQFITGMPLALVFMCVFWGWTDFSPGDIGAFFYTLVRIMQPVRALSLVVSDFQKGVAAAESVFKVCDLPQEIHIGDIPFTLDTMYVNDMCYVAGERVIFDKLSMQFAPDKIHVIVGASGIGKSTLLSILAQLVHVDSGNISVGSHSYQHIDLLSFRKNVGYMDQMPFVWDDTLINNIIFPDKVDTLNDALLHQILDITSLTSWIETLPYHVHTMIGTDAFMPSGGQKQRIALARVLYHKSQVILLDEPAAAVDENTALKIMQYLESLKKNRIIIIIAHQKFIAEKADLVHYMTPNKIISGTHDDLIRVASYNAYWQMGGEMHDNA